MPTLHWLSREKDLQAAGRAPYRLLEHVETYGESNTDNMVIQGDNLDGLKALLPYYAGQVKCIYIDPPYNTRSAFAHYDDNLEHTKWLSMMYPRLELLRDLLSEEGSIWANIDDHEAHYMKVIMDEIFGRKNFLCDIAWEKRYSPPPDTKDFGYIHDHILVYRKTPKFKRNLLSLTEDQAGRYKNPDGDLRGPWKAMDYTCRFTSDERPNLYYPIYQPNTKKEIFPKKTRVWAMSREVHERNVAENRLWWGVNGTNNVPALKNFFSEINQGMMPMSIWKYTLAGHNQEAMKEMLALYGNEIFSTPKPERLIQRVFHIATNPGDLVLDSFLGSGTTAAVAHKMGRRYIGIEIGGHATTHCLPRLQKVVAGEQGGISKAVNWQGGGGFRFYRLGEPIFLENGQIRPDISFAQLAAHVWFSETRTPWRPSAAPTPFLGVCGGTAYYLLYNGVLKDKSVNGGNVLTTKILESLPPHDGPKVIYGERCLFSEGRRKDMDIIFRHTPYDIKGR
jgi:adenine-specific DNA-methyltransferase